MRTKEVEAEVEAEAREWRLAALVGLVLAIVALTGCAGASTLIFNDYPVVVVNENSVPVQVAVNGTTVCAVAPGGTCVIPFRIARPLSTRSRVVRREYIVTATGTAPDGGMMTYSRRVSLQARRYRETRSTEVRVRLRRVRTPR